MNLSEFVGLDYLKTPHREFYGAVVEKLGLDNVSNFFPRDIKTLIAAYKKDPYFNTIKLHYWDGASGFMPYTDKTGQEQYKKYHGIRELLLDNSVNVYSVSECVCILKEAARIAVESEIKKEAGNETLRQN